MAQLRRQLTLLLPESERAAVDAVRSRLDPKQHAIIPAHVTLCRDSEIVAWTDVCAALASLAAVDITLEFGRPEQLEDGCVLLPVSGTTAAYDQIRKEILGRSGQTHRPHITLLHPRHAAGVAVELAALAREPFPTVVQFTEIALIEQTDGGVWEVVNRYGSGS